MEDSLNWPNIIYSLMNYGTWTLFEFFLKLKIFHSWKFRWICCIMVLQKGG